MTTVVTGWSPSGWESYGRRFAETFARFWPEDVALVSYVERDVTMPRGECRSLWDCAGAAVFFEEHRGDPVACGKKPTSRWSPKDRRNPYAWRFDTVKWFRQCLIPEHAGARLQDGEVLCWLDADVVTDKPIPRNFVESLLGESDLVYLGRKNTHSEIGFWAVRMGPLTRRLLMGMADAYRSGRVFSLPEWHSAFVFDVVRREMEAIGLRSRDMTPGRRGHVWHDCILGEYTDHLKGEMRKRLGRSPERRVRR